MVCSGKSIGTFLDWRCQWECNALLNSFWDQYAFLEGFLNIFMGYCLAVCLFFSGRIEFLRGAIQARDLRMIRFFHYAT